MTFLVRVSGNILSRIVVLDPFHSNNLKNPYLIGNLVPNFLRIFSLTIS
jgi:hypothetical protein